MLTTLQTELLALASDPGTAEPAPAAEPLAWHERRILHALAAGPRRASEDGARQLADLARRGLVAIAADRSVAITAAGLRELST